jgi:quercetin dioxygenase-like cupin family protein
MTRRARPLPASASSDYKSFNTEKPMHRDEFLALLSQEGFNEVVTVTRDANGTLDVHAHPFEAKALILTGDVTIRIGDDARKYGVGDIFHLRTSIEHAEDYGPEGVSYLVGRK